MICARPWPACACGPASSRTTEAREALEADVDEMTAMLDSLLAYLGGQEDPEPQRRTDLAAIAMTLVDDAVDAGRPATYAGLDHLSVQAGRCR
jgi:hypothetical protein